MCGKESDFPEVDVGQHLLFEALCKIKNGFTSILYIGTSYNTLVVHLMDHITNNWVYPPDQLQNSKPFPDFFQGQCPINKKPFRK